ncbi:MAG: hypothetical protein IJE19_03320 [Clostridia bacterium]|nr:hypothetical protein [Clostridia bacterium]
MICRKVGEDTAGKPIYKKRNEIRKIKPKLPTPFKGYIYCTKGKPTLGRCLIDNSLKATDETDFDNYNRDTLFRANGKVIGEFVCDYINEYECEFVDDECFEWIASIDRDEDGDITGFYEWTNEFDIPYTNTEFFEKCCIEYEDLKKYIGIGIDTFYACHISNLVIYDKPKELSEFYTEDFEEIYSNWEDLFTIGVPSDCSAQFPPEPKREDYIVKRPPQSWCYVEVLENG